MQRHKILKERSQWITGRCPSQSEAAVHLALLSENSGEENIDCCMPAECLLSTRSTWSSQLFDLGYTTQDL